MNSEKQFATENTEITEETRQTKHISVLFVYSVIFVA